MKLFDPFLVEWVVTAMGTRTFSVIKSRLAPLPLHQCTRPGVIPAIERSGEQAGPNHISAPSWPPCAGEVLPENSWGSATGSVHLCPRHRWWSLEIISVGSSVIWITLDPSVLRDNSSGKD